MKKLLLSLFLLTGCSTINVPTLEQEMRQSYFIGCRDEVHSTPMEQSEDGARIRGAKYQACLKRATEFDLYEVEGFRSDLDLVISNRQSRGEGKPRQ